MSVVLYAAELGKQVKEQKTEVDHSLEREIYWISTLCSLQPGHLNEDINIIVLVDL